MLNNDMSLVFGSPHTLRVTVLTHSACTIPNTSCMDIYNSTVKVTFHGVAVP